jgi:hypothetical protein
MAATVLKLKAADEDRLYRHANAFRDLEPRNCELDRLAYLLAEKIDSTDNRERDIAAWLAYKLEEAAAKLKDEYRQLWGECA